jgi:DNA-binding GntR family transcriptional regulator
MLRAETSAGRTVAAVRELILRGVFPAGSRLGEVELAERLGVSRTPVREAFLRLQAEGLLRLIPKRGAVVVPVSPEEAEDVLDAREAIEIAAVRRLLTRPDLVPAAVADLRAALRIQQAHADAGDVHAFAAADEDFHGRIVAAGRNGLTIRFYATLAERQQRMSMRALGPVPERLPGVLREHAELIATIENGDEQGFGTALRAHLDGIHRS